MCQRANAAVYVEERRLEEVGKSIERGAAELRPHEFNFHCLGTDFALSAALNQQAFIRRLKTLWPDLGYDDTLLKHPPILDDQIVSSEPANTITWELVRQILAETCRNQF